MVIAKCSPKAFRFCSILLEQLFANFCIDKQSYWMNCLAKGNMKKPVMSLMTSLDDEDGLEVIMVFIGILSFPYATYLFSV